MTRTSPPRELLLSIGGVTGLLAVDLSDPFIQELRDRYQDFLIPPAPWVGREFSLSLSVLPPPSPASGDTLPQVRSKGREIEIDRWDFHLHLRQEKDHTPWTGSGTVRENVYSMDTLLRVLWSVLLGRVGGALIHASSFKTAQGGFLFPGPSGAGKTTLARKVPFLEDVLSDEIVPVRRGELEGWRVYPSPFWGEFGKGRGSLSGFPLRAVGFLEKGDPLEVAPLPPGEAVQRLLETILGFEFTPSTVQRNVEFASRLVSEVPSALAVTCLETPAEELADRLGRLSRPLPEPTRSPRTSREAISEIRSQLRAHGQHAIISAGTSMRPWIRSGDTLFIQALGSAPPRPGDILVSWIPGETEEDDTLVCHRMIAGRPETCTLTRVDAHGSIDRVRHGREAEILGIVIGRSRDGETRILGGRLRKLETLLTSLVAAPVLHVRRALR